ncbi:hypothetical protein C7410_115201 [Paraburkholderia silvatlantica]|uniref:Uncharacterized protein n=1 Tax=Paraburkholderia silvatlantica TaxID=321895 RepID=A0A2V4TJD9_9BURK|nr:hypothetical protein [Paraburkholderia silvatlantica]PYE21358.1 hypothetical protein C7410_115201 [Paraburkholderia silvatlantica]
MNRLSYSIVLLANSYLEMTYIAWLDKWVYRRTVDFNSVCLQ